ncbi:hypothetical protein HY085_01885 [Candidatus Gottesmanbacteria bacterium]|nr:hypothetical protein [Candidatus Gottesmanbacteria bacterium]
MSGSRNIIAAFLGILMLILVILAARWTGERIKEKFSQPKNITSVVVQKSQSKPDPTASISAIPVTGPNNLNYYFLIVVFTSGLFCLLTTLRIKTYI